jgi:hypothetical protein
MSCFQCLHERCSCKSASLNHSVEKAFEIHSLYSSFRSHLIVRFYFVRMVLQGAYAEEFLTFSKLTCAGTYTYNTSVEPKLTDCVSMQLSIADPSCVVTSCAIIACISVSPQIINCFVSVRHAAIHFTHIHCSFADVFCAVTRELWWPVSVSCDKPRVAP